MKLLITGANGQVGRALAALEWGPAVSLFALDSGALDITDLQQVRQTFACLQPDMVINAAAYTAVDKAEDDAAAAYLVNRNGPEYLARACAAQGAKLVHFSTDYVFDGEKRSPYLEADPVGPVSVYGASKEAGEHAVRRRLPEGHIILRTAWVYSATRQNFVKTMLRLGRERDELGVVADQTGCPTSADDIAGATLQIVLQLMSWQANTPSPVWGSYHLCAAGEATWFDFASEIYRLAAQRGFTPPRLHPVTTADYPTRARRPANSVLDCTRVEETFGVRRQHWKDSLPQVIESLLGIRKGGS